MQRLRRWPNPRMAKDECRRWCGTQPSREREYQLFNHLHFFLPHRAAAVRPLFINRYAVKRPAVIAANHKNSDAAANALAPEGTGISSSDASRNTRFQISRPVTMASAINP